MCRDEDALRLKTNALNDERRWYGGFARWPARPTPPLEILCDAGARNATPTAPRCIESAMKSGSVAAIGPLASRAAAGSRCPARSRGKYANARRRRGR